MCVTLATTFGGFPALSCTFMFLWLVFLFFCYYLRSAAEWWLSLRCTVSLTEHEGWRWCSRTICEKNTRQWRIISQLFQKTMLLFCFFPPSFSAFIPRRFAKCLQNVRLPEAPSEVSLTCIVVKIWVLYIPFERSAGLVLGWTSSRVFLFNFLL